MNNNLEIIVASEKFELLSKEYPYEKQYHALCVSPFIIVSIPSGSV